MCHGIPPTAAHVPVSPVVCSQARCLRALQLFPPPDSATERKALHDVLQNIIATSESGGRRDSQTIIAVFGAGR